MHVVVWIAPGTWPAAVAAVRERPESDTVTLVTADDPDAAMPPGVLDSLMGRGHRGPHPEVASVAADEARGLVDQATAALGRPCEARLLAGVTERVVTAAAAEADLLVIVRDGDRSRLGPRSLGRQARFIIDHAPCTVELLWPAAAPDLRTIPPVPGA